MSKFFSVKDFVPETVTQEDKSTVLMTEFLSFHDHKINNVNDLISSFPANNQVYFLWTVNSFNAFTFIPYLLKNAGIIEQLIISTYSINIKIIDALAKYLEKDMIGSIFILISDSANFRIPKVVDHLNQFNLNYPGRTSVRYAWNHSKITLVKSADNHFVIEGSGNFSDNSRHEQYVFLNSKQVFSFRKEWIINEIHGRTI